MSTVQCSTGVRDCAFDDSGPCAPYNGRYKDPQEMDWLVPLAAIFMCCNAFGVGANDVANAWGTSVASGAIALRKACIIAGIANILGAVTLGYGVSDAIQKGVAEIQDPDCWACGYCNSKMSLYAVGMFGALIGSSAFLLLATFGSAPVSGTHAVVGGVVGMTLAATSGGCLDWSIGGLGGIVLSWVLSPLVAGIIGAGLYVLTDKYIIQARDPRTRSLTFMPIFVALSVFIIVFLILLKSKVTKHALPVYGHFFLGVVAGIIAYFGGWFWRDRYIIGSLPSEMRKKLNDVAAAAAAAEPASAMEMDSKAEFKQEEVGTVDSSVIIDDTLHQQQPQDEHQHQQEMQKKQQQQDEPELGLELGQNDPKAADATDVTKDMEEEEEEGDPSMNDALHVFKYLIVFNASLESFAHGSNDTGNATAPFSAVLNTVNEGIHNCKAAETPEWVLFVAGCCVALGVNTFGYRVMKTVGEKITVINFHKGFCIEFASTAAVVIATLLKFPVSTTHCQIGAVVAVGCASVGYKKVSFGVIGQIVLSWIITLPFAGLFAAMMLAIIESGIER